MTIIKEQYTTKDGNTYLVAEIDGREIRWEAPGEHETGADLIAAVEANADMLLADSYRREYPLAALILDEGETELDAWERIVAAGEDDEGTSLEECKNTMF